VTDQEQAEREEPRWAWAPFHHRVFRALWIAQFVGNLGTYAQTVGAQWLMGDLGGSAFEVALIQTASSLPVFLLVIPAGALGDIIDRRRLLIIGQAIALVAAAALAAMTLIDVVTPALLLALTALLAVGSSLSLPTFKAVQPELVPRDEVPDAAVLNGVSSNLARTLGPAMAGLLIAGIGSEANFALNALSFAAVIIVLLAWHRPPDERAVAPEHLLDAIVAGARYARHSRSYSKLLGRTLVFVLCASALWSLLAVLARGPLELGPTGYGITLGAVGIGALLGTTVVPELRRRYGENLAVAFGSALFGAGLVVAGLVDVPAVAIVALAAVGFGWINVTSNLNSTAQLLLPNWTRARGLSLLTLAYQAAYVVGSLLFGAVAEWANVQTAFAVAGAGAIAGALAGLGPLALPGLPDVSPVRYWPDPDVVVEPGPRAGPVLVIVEWRIDPDRATEFAQAMQPVGRARRQTGATRWGLLQDADDPALLLETFTVANWSEHLRQHLERGIESDKDLEAAARAFLTDSQAPRARHLLPPDIREHGGRAGRFG
jgi:MFS family permease